MSKVGSEKKRRFTPAQREAARLRSLEWRKKVKEDPERVKEYKEKNCRRMKEHRQKSVKESEIPRTLAMKVEYRERKRRNKAASRARLREAAGLPPPRSYGKKALPLTSLTSGESKRRGKPLDKKELPPKKQTTKSSSCLKVQMPFKKTVKVKKFQRHLNDAQKTIDSPEAQHAKESLDSRDISEESANAQSNNLPEQVNALPEQTHVLPKQENTPPVHIRD